MVIVGWMVDCFALRYRSAWLVVSGRIISCHILALLDITRITNILLIIINITQQRRRFPQCIICKSAVHSV